MVVVSLIRIVDSGYLQTGPETVLRGPTHADVRPRKKEETKIIHKVDFR